MKARSNAVKVLGIVCALLGACGDGGDGGDGGADGSVGGDGSVEAFRSEMRRDVPVSEWSEAERTQFCAEVDAYMHGLPEVVEVICTFWGRSLEDAAACQEYADMCVADGATAYKAKCFHPGSSTYDDLAACTATAQQIEECVTRFARVIVDLQGVLTCEMPQRIESVDCDAVDFEKCGFSPLKPDWKTDPSECRRLSPAGSVGSSRRSSSSRRCSRRRFRIA